MADRYWVGGSGSWGTGTTNWSATSGGASGASAPTAADNAIFDANSDTGGPFTVTMAAGTRSVLDFNASDLDAVMTLDTGSLRVYGNWINHATNFATTGTGTIVFYSSVAGRTVNTNNVSIAANVEFGVASTGGWTLNSNFTCASSVALSFGSLNLNNYNLTCNKFVSNNSNSRSIAFGTSGKIYITATANLTVLDMVNVQNFTYTGTSYIGLTGNTGGGITRTIEIDNNSNDFIESQAMDIYVLAGSGSLEFKEAINTKTLDCTGFNGTLIIKSSNPNNIYGGLILPSTVTYQENVDVPINFVATSGTYTINCQVAAVGNEFIFNALGATYNLANTLTFAVNPSKGVTEFTLQNGTLNANNSTVNCGRYILTGGTLNMGSSTFSVNDSSNLTPWTRTSTTISAGTSTIDIPHTTASTYVFAGGGATYYNISLTGATGSTVLSITGNNTFNNILSSKTVAYTIVLAASSTTTMNGMAISGLSGNLVSLVSSNLTTPTACTITASSGTVNYAIINSVNLTSANTATATNSAVINSNNWNIATTSERWALLISGSSWTAPSDWATTGNQIHVIGGGGGGAGCIPSGVAGGGGGGGGGYVGASNISITPGTAYSYTVGTAGAAGAGSLTSSTGGTGGTSSFNAFSYPTFVASSTATASSSTTLVINKPAGTVTNDLMVAFLDSSSTSNTWTGPAGWTEVSDVNGRVAYYKTASSSEGASYTFTASGTNNYSGTIITYRYAAVDVTGTWSLSNNPSVAAAITTTVRNTIIIAACATSDSNVTITTPTGYTSIVSNETGSFPSYKVSFKQQATAGSTGTVSSTLTGTPGGRSILIALKSSTFQATGGTGGTATSAPSSTAGTGGTGSGGLSYTGGTGGVGATSGTAGRAPGGGGGAAGPNGNGGNGGVGIGSNVSASDAGGGGGGGNGGGTAGGIGTTVGGTGGNNFLGTGGGASIQNGTLGGGGGGATISNGAAGDGGNGADIIINVAGGGGGGGGGDNAPGGLYGGGGGGSGTSSTSATLQPGSAGATGAIFIGYTGTYVLPTSTGNMMLLFM